VRLTDGNDHLTIEAAQFPSGFEGSPVDPDVLLNVTVQLRGYTAKDQLWVEAGDWCEFVRQFTDLDLKRRGEAILLGGNPDELTLRFHVYDAAGHTAVEGHIARRGTVEEHQRARVTFAMRFDPGYLEAAATEFRSYRKCGGR
jgi:hypothetical protein